MWQKLVQNNDPLYDFETESQAYDYVLGEPLPSKPDYQCPDGGLLITIKVPTVLKEWSTSIEDAEEPLFQVYKYHEKVDDKADLYYEEVLRGMTKGDNKINCNIFFSPGRYYIRLNHCNATISNTTCFSPENWLIQFNDTSDEKPFPKWSSTPTSAIWRAVFALKFKIRKADLYLGFELKQLQDKNLLFGTFYHAPDVDGVIRTFIFDGKSQLIEGQKI